MEPDPFCLFHRLDKGRRVAKNMRGPSPLFPMLWSSQGICELPVAMIREAWFKHGDSDHGLVMVTLPWITETGEG